MAAAVKVCTFREYMTGFVQTFLSRRGLAPSRNASIGCSPLPSCSWPVSPQTRFASGRRRAGFTESTAVCTPSGALS